MTRHGAPGMLAALAMLGSACTPEAPDTDAGAPPAPEPTRPAVFTEVELQAGLGFRHFAAATEQHYFAEIVGAGVALIDYDSDGDLDVYLLQGAVIDPRWQLVGDSPAPEPRQLGNRLFRNELVPSGALHFTDVTDGAGVGHQGYGMGAAVGDIDNDGDADLYVTNLGSNVLYRNEGNGRFLDITAASGTDDARWSTSATFVDYDLDGDLDLFSASYVAADTDSVRECFSVAGLRDYCNPENYPPLIDRLFRNEGDGRYSDVGLTHGIDAPAPGLGVVAADFDGDGWPDLYVANDGRANQLWRNRGDGSFEDVAIMSGAAYNMHGRAEASMGVTAGDFDGDGDEDLFMTHLATESNTLYANDGHGGFADVTDRYRLGGPSLSFTGFGSAWFDFDNDGLLELFVANGGVYIESTRIGVSSHPYEQRNQLFHHEAGLGFSDWSLTAGAAMQRLEVSRGAAFGDIDNDGDIDIVVTNNNGPVRLLRNDWPTANAWLRVRLEGTESPRDGTGAHIALLREGRPSLWRRAHTDGSYLSASDPRVHFGLSGDEPVDALIVRWPGGRQEQWRNVPLNSESTLVEGSGEPVSGPGRGQPPGPADAPH